MEAINSLVHNFGVTILILTVLVRLAFFPLASKQFASMAKMKKLQPQMEHYASATRTTSRSSSKRRRRQRASACGHACRRCAVDMYRWIISRVEGLARSVDAQMRKFELGEAARQVYDFVWGEFADWYIEIAKVRARDARGGCRHRRCRCLRTCSSAACGCCIPLCPS